MSWNSIIQNSDNQNTLHIKWRKSYRWYFTIVGHKHKNKKKITMLSVKKIVARAERASFCLSNVTLARTWAARWRDRCFFFVFSRDKSPLLCCQEASFSSLPWPSRHETTKNPIHWIMTKCWKFKETSSEQFGNVLTWEEERSTQWTLKVLM